jgi:hypothetical protein
MESSPTAEAIRLSVSRPNVAPPNARQTGLENMGNFETAAISPSSDGRSEPVLTERG